MRVVEVEQLQENMVVGKTIFSSSGNVMLKKGAILKKPLINTIQHTDLLAIYIEDEFSKGIEPKDLIDDRFRNNTVKKIKTFFTTPPDRMSIATIASFQRELDVILKNIIDQVLGSRDSVVNLVSLKNHDDYTFQHSVNVSVITTVLGIGLGFDRDKLVDLVQGAVYHDIGKMLIEKEILNKPGALTYEEFLRIKQHPELGFDFARGMLNLSIGTLVGIIQHHEKYDGNGYPAAKEGSKIHINAQVIAIADVFDAITSKRPYHDARPPSEAIEYIMGNSEIHFSKEVVDVFLAKVAVYPIGSKVTLSNGSEGIVCANTEGCTLRPVVKIFTDNPQKMYVDLASSEYSDIVITSVVI